MRTTRERAGIEETAAARRPAARRRRATVRWLLGVSLIFFAGVQIVTLGTVAWEAERSWRQAERNAEINAIGDALLQAARAHAFERGRATLALRALAPIAAAERAFIDTQRARADAAMDQTLAGLERAAPLGVQNGRTRLRATLSEMLALRPLVDQALATPRAARPPDLARRWLAAACAALDEIDHTLSLIANDIHDQDGTLRELARIDLAALRLREVAGREALLAAAAIERGQRIPLGERAEIASVRALDAAHWKEFEERIETLGGSTLRDALDRARVGYQAPMARLRAMLDRAAEDGDYPLTADAYVDAARDALVSLAALMDASVAATSERARLDQVAAQRALALSALALALGLLLSGILLHTVRDRVLHPLGRLTARVRKLLPEAADAMPGGDEIDLLTLSVAGLEERSRHLGATIAELRQTRNDLADSEAALRDMLDAITEAVLVLDVDGTVRIANETVAARLKTTVAEMLGRDIHALMPPELRESRRAEVARMIASGQRARFEDSRGDHRFLHSLYPVHGPDGSVRRVVVISFDITELRRAEEALRRLARHHELILSSMGEGLVGLDAFGRVTFVNPAASRLTGWSAADFSKLSHHEVVHHTRADGAPYPIEDCPIFQTLQDGVPRHVLDDVFWRRDRTRFPVEFTATAIKEDERITGAVLLFRDITERQRMETELVRAKTAAEAAARAKDGFLANMSHEIRTPLNAILGLTQILERENLADDHARYIHQIIAAGHSLLSILNDILDLSKIEAGRLELEVAPFDPRGTLGDLVAVAASSAREKGLAIRLAIDPGVPRALIGDALRLRQVVMNLLGNAVKFTERGEVVLTVALETEGPDFVEPRFEIRDTGIGISAEARTRLFQPFTQADNSTTRRFGGTGLGLAICQRLVGLMGGRIGVDSLPGQGSRFWFTARFARAAAAASAAQSPTAPSAGRPPPSDWKGRLKGARVLLAEDNLINQEVARSLLERAGASVTIVGDGRGAVEKLRRERTSFDVILMDIQMPEMDGVEATLLLRRDLGVTLPIVALTAGVMASERQRYEEAGMNAILAKPIDAQAMIATLEPLLAERLGAAAGDGA